MIPRPGAHALTVFACDLVLNTPEDEQDTSQGGGIFAALDLLSDPENPRSDLDRQVALIFVNWLRKELGDDAVRQVRARNAALMGSTDA